MTAVPFARWRSLSPVDRSLLICAFATVLVTSAALRLLGTKRSAKAGYAVARVPGAPPPDRLAWAVAAASRRCPGSTCLVQSLALRALLARAGWRSYVEIGVSTETRFEAHAWVVCDGQVLLGGENRSRYSSVAVLF
jgi:hypothetical protein